jgi:hypothetical protein
VCRTGQPRRRGIRAADLRGIGVERLPQHQEIYLYWSMIHVMAARVARRQPSAPSAPVPAGTAQAAPARTLPQAA